MESKQKTINEVLRHTMHDYLNNLHLIQMNLDMGRYDEAKNLIRTYSLKCTQFFDVNNTGLLLTNEWLQTFSLAYNKITLEFGTSIQKVGAGHYDEPVKNYLERFVQTIYPLLKGYQEQTLNVYILTADVLEVQVELKGEWSTYTWVDECLNGLMDVEKEINSDSHIKFKLIARERLE
ncbi:Spo0B domain-containing protein [Bacillus sp. FJAT-22090]|jgi:stage 0 sporulation protein B (sporulation initiation phosphotransferase)|uniref:Spo0B domain-containing protein n=1 Tax=Bacillus sp. FJAT-22090 TaxID=1581038 RepID=UPI0006AE0EA3|nr:Spo0B domain-containing protein [Bacillus sp. FJAT-22090]